MFRILHLSDLHARESTRWSSDALLGAARESLLRECEQDNFDVLAFTGDIAFSGTTSEYEIAAEWIEDVCISPDGLNLDQDRILVVPGNHDVDRRQISNEAFAIEEVLATASTQQDIARFFEDDSCLRTLLKRHESYIAFCERLRGDGALGLPSWAHHFAYGDYLIGFEGLSTSCLCRGDDDQRRLLIGQPQLTDRMNERQDCDIRIALLHHPLSDLMKCSVTFISSNASLGKAASLSLAVSAGDSSEFSFESRTIIA